MPERLPLFDILKGNIFRDAKKIQKSLCITTKTCTQIQNFVQNQRKFVTLKIKKFVKIEIFASDLTLKNQHFARFDI